MKHVLSVLVNDQPGVLARVAGLFSRRGFNIESITVGNAEEAGLSRMTLVTSGDERTLEQIMKQLHKLVDVIKVNDLTEEPMVARELVLIKVAATATTRPEITHLIEPFRAAIVDVGRNSLVVQATGDMDKIDALIELLRPYGIKEIARTGVTALMRGSLVKVRV
ncbi:acetolactate synthase small subunit [Kyrpidia spormannii]|uniref:Acetohydroxy-acid synthase (Small subunit) n=2 Tax=Kyrpidia spormannii TaxID=2055160 RepID=A0ACA8ZBP6_9BACL|nr:MULTISPECIES: acetolactate synthase small subunit [Kyrpidia]ATY85469.1 acetolactate synthase small subunit [Kyrpidia spormannii]MCL6575464.1 acetolactate synthase small subunit [Kyrpidia sp.]CAB3393663.1 acetohydroxy-acid synthase (small subunit) [Kyrpidia spormannii]HHY65758.1 acetolactate synthase small subunit [Alicyclobacillus sp.]